MPMPDERRQQELAASDRFEQVKDDYEATKKRLQDESAATVDSPDRVEARRRLIHPNDGLALERILDGNDLIPVNYLEAGQRAARSVCRIQIRRRNGRNAGFGTGFLVSPTLLLTNHHVLESEEMVIRSLAEFDFENDLDFIPKNSKLFRLDPARFFYNNRELDFALVAVHPQATDNTPLSEFGFLNLIEPSGKALIGESVSIIQHPEGADKQIALRNNQILGVFEHFIHYETDTMPGSSGSPALNDQWEVVALHHAGVPKRNRNGRVMAKSGRVWDPEMGRDAIDWIANEGVRISSIFKHLRAKNDWKPNELLLLSELEGVGLSDQASSFRTEFVNVAIVDTQAETAIITPPKSITLEEFFRLVDNEETTEEQLAPYIQFAPESSGAFGPIFKLNQDLVIDTSGLESDRALTWANSWARRRRHKKYRRKLAQGGDLIKIVSEGDSWFQFPFLLRDIIDHLLYRDELAVFSLGAAGDHLRNMTTEAEYIDIIERENPEVFLISGGGNDLVGNGRLSRMLHRFEAGRAPDDYLNETFTAFMNEIRFEYNRLFESLSTQFPNLTILCHGYDYAIPQGDRWLGRPMEENGIIDHRLQREIIQVIIDHINQTLARVAAQFPKVKYLDLRNVISPDGWFDELHPLNKGFGDIASIFVDEIFSSRV